MAINLPIVSKFYDQGVKSAQGSLKKFGQFAAKSAAAAGAAIAGIATVSIKAFGDFDAALNKSISIMGDVSESLRTDMSDAAREVAKSTTFSAEEAADAYFFLASAGLDAQQSIAAMPQVAKFAQAGMFDMALATDLATDAQSALGLTSDDAAENLANLTRVTDVFVKANTLANTSVEQLATAFTTKAGNALKTVGKDIEEGAAALAVFADQGIKGERAGTLLTNTIFGLTDTLERNGDEYKKLGLELFDSEGAMLGFADIAKQFTGVLGDMTTEQKINTLSQLGFTKQAREGILALVGNSDALTEYEQKLRDAGGTVDEVSQKQLLTFNAQMELLKSRLMDVAIEIGSALAPKLQMMLDKISPIIDQAGPVLVELFDNLWKGAEEIGARLKPLLDKALPGLKTIFDNLQEPVGKVVEFLLVLGEKVLSMVTDLISAPLFQKALEFMGDAFGKVAEEVKKLVESPLVDFLAKIGGAVIVAGITAIATALEFLAGVLNAVNDAIDRLSGKSVPNLGGQYGSFDPYGSSSGTSSYKYGSVPKFADGGVVMPRPGGTLGVIGEAGQAEAVIPLDRLNSMMSGGGGRNFSITVNAGMGADGTRIGEQIVNEILRFERSSGRVFARA
jgi:TP901 family phage tail tape measure protein